MTKEELEKEAEVFAEKHAFRVPYDGSNKFYDDVDFKASKEGYIAGAKPREKRIAELEKRCANYEMTISKMEKGTCDICKEIEKDKKIEALEQQIEKMKCCGNCQTVRDAEGNCYLKKDGKCKNLSEWEIKEVKNNG